MLFICTSNYIGNPEKRFLNATNNKSKSSLLPLSHRKDEPNSSCKTMSVLIKPTHTYPSRWTSIVIIGIFWWGKEVVEILKSRIRFVLDIGLSHRRMRSQTCNSELLKSTKKTPGRFCDHRTRITVSSSSSRLEVDVQVPVLECWNSSVFRVWWWWWMNE